MIKPVNGHILIEPLIHDSFMASQRESYDEIGTVKAVPDIMEEIAIEEAPSVGDRVFFDSWLAARYPTGEGDNFFWLVRFDDVRAIEKHE